MGLSKVKGGKNIFRDKKIKAKLWIFAKIITHT